jgi:hypothetical protein
MGYSTIRGFRYEERPGNPDRPRVGTVAPISNPTFAGLMPSV